METLSRPTGSGTASRRTRPPRSSRRPNRKWTVLAMLVVFAAIAIGAGAAAGNVMGTGSVEATIPVTVSQALLVNRPEPQDLPNGRKFFASTADDSTKFSFALEMYRGESMTVLVPIRNRSSNNTVAEFSVIVPDVPSLIEGVPGLVIEVTGSGEVDDVVRISPDSWAFTADALMGGSPDGLLVTVKVAPTSMAGFFEVSGRVRSTEF